MYLLDTSKITLHKFSPPNVPNYAILSHRWASTEVSFDTILKGKAKKQLGYSKVKKCCAQAALDGWQYVWIDTCCIDHSSSAELSEAINSMYQWYKESGVCYAYLSDVETVGSYLEHWRDGSKFRRSEWFTRGWTLQELLAPENVVFFDRNWIEIGTKSTFVDVLSSTTGIKDLDHLGKTSVAQKMSWASQRRTTRPEDMAYCLLGLFGINMPILYGEGENAFIRLQLEIIGKVNDESIFAWVGVSRYFSGVPYPLLTSSPAAFRSCGDIVCTNFDKERPPYSMTNRGLRLEPLLFAADQRTEEVWTQDIDQRAYTMPLNCSRKRTGEQVAIMLVDDVQDKNRFERCCAGVLLSWNETYRKTSIALGRRLIFVEQSIDLDIERWPIRDSILLKFRSPFLHDFRTFEFIGGEGFRFGELQYTNKIDSLALMEDRASYPMAAILFNNST